MMNKLIEFAPDFAVALATTGLSGYLIALGLAAFFPGKVDSLGGRLGSWFTKYPAQNLGIPCAAFSAFAIVTIFTKLFPYQSSPGSQMELRVFSLEFSGPSGPITLWLMCFLGFIAALKLLRTP